MILVYFILVIIALLLVLLIFNYNKLTVPAYRGKISDHFNGKKFVSHDNNQMGTFKDLLVYQIKTRQVKWPTLNESDVEFGTVDVKVDVGIKYKFINHATILIQHQGVNIITDPVYVKRASPFQFMGPSRRRPPSIRYEDLPKIDLVLLSHDHYDHLDLTTIIKLSNDHSPLFLVGLGLKRFLERFNVKNVHQMDWQEVYQFKGLDLTFLPAKHWSNRGLSPFKTLWGSFMIQSSTKTIYFAGDSGFDKHFQEIKDQFKHIDLAFIPIGAYIPRNFMKYVHMPPEDALKAHKILSPTKSLAIHWGTFKLTGENMYDPVDLLQELMDNEGITNFDYDRHHNQYYFFE